MGDTDGGGFQVLMNELAAQEKNLDTAASHINTAATALQNVGELPVLDPGQTKLLAILGVGLGFLSANPLGVIAGGLGGGELGHKISEATDPYPAIRMEWLNQLPRYAQAATDAKTKVQQTVAAYQAMDHGGKKSMDEIHPK
jgi:hypothetical protein